MTRRQKLVLSLVAAAASAAVTVPIIANSAPGDPLLPDLVSDSPSGARFGTFDPVNGVNRLLLRFDGYIHNAGDGPLDLQGNPQLAAGTPGAMDQYIWNGSGPRSGTGAAWTRVTDHPVDPIVVFDSSDTHNHFHVKRAAEYSLWNDAKTAIVAPANKVGFCQYDSEWVDDFGPTIAVYGDALTGDFCRQAQPEATQLREGISEGYRDIYDWTLDYQWIDVSNVAPGTYRLAGRMDPDNVFKEKNEANNGYAWSDPVIVPGYRAKAVGPIATAYRTAVGITLDADEFKTPPSSLDPYGKTLGARLFRITKLPAGGILKRGNTVLSVGSSLPTGTNDLQYIPNANFSGQDGFEFAAINTGSSYPAEPSRATASVTVGGSGASVVNLSGAPGQMLTGTQVQFNATSSSGGAIQWSATAGSITQTGVFTAPDTVPPGGSVTVRAALKDDIGAFKEVVIPIVASGTPSPMPVVPGAGTSGPLSKPGVLLKGRNVTVTVLTTVSGTVAISLNRGSVRLDGCQSTAQAGQTVSCKFQLSKPYDAGTLLVKARLTTPAKKVYTAQSLAGPANFRRVVAVHRGRRITLLVVPQRPGFVTVVMTANGKAVGRCAARVRPNGSLSCTRSVGTAPVAISVSLRDNQGKLAVRDLRK